MGGKQAAATGSLRYLYSDPHPLKPQQDFSLMLPPDLPKDPNPFDLLNKIFAHEK